MRKLLVFMVLGITLLFAKVDLNSATKEELMKIKGIGEKKAELIIEYRKTKKIQNEEQLVELKGFGPSLIKTIKEENK
jgi:competence protein ComEA